MPALLVVEDEVLVRILLADELGEHGYAVIEAASADEDLLRSGIVLDFVATDMHMPGTLDGIALARQVRTEFPALKVIMVSGRNPDPSVADFLYGFFPKPCDTNRLMSYLSTLLPEVG